MDFDNKHVRGRFTFRIERGDNDTFVASLVNQQSGTESDAKGALYYVIVVILIYGCSILMMIASYIRKNKNDRKLTRYLKDMAAVRKRERQLQLYNVAAKAAAQSSKSPSNMEQTSQSDRMNSIRDQYSPALRNSTSNVTEESYRPNDEGLDTQHIPGPGDPTCNQPYVKIVFETSDGDSDSAFAFDFDTSRGDIMQRRTHISRADDVTSCDEDEREDDVKEMLLDPEDSENQMDDSESDQFTDKSSKLQWTDFQVISSV